MSLNTTSGPLVWLITGTSQGFGRELVQAALDRGDSVVATSRNPQKVASYFPDAGGRLLTISMDLSKPAEIQAGVDATIDGFGKIDVLVNNAGHGLLGAIEEAADVEIASVYETNVFGLLRLTRAVLPHMRERRSGHVVNLSSIGGLVGLPGWGIYNSTKFAVEGISEALAQEVGPLGIGVTIVEPGPFRTEFLGNSLVHTETVLDAYEKTAGGTRNYASDRDGKQQGDPRLAAEAIVQAITSEKPPLHLLLGAMAYQRASKKLDEMRADFEAWRELTLSTDFAK
jgi:NAD(P)-dependent dehydrogenase (short-subunit alcohol dehydrogenase family)